MIFIDSDAFLGISNPSDALHNRAIALLKYQTDDLVTSWDVIDEVTTKLSYHFSKSHAIEFLKSLAVHNITIEFLDKVTSEVAKEIFISLKSKNVSMTDCANMAIAKKLKINIFFSFDEHYTKNGFKLLSTHT
jgi:predicted nucleic acid-binding protein